MNKNIKDCILKIIPKDHSWKIMLLENWGNIIGDLKNSITIEQIKEDVLFLGVDHPTWAQELLALSPLLKEKINTYFKQERINAIRIRLKKNKEPKFKHKTLHSFNKISTVLTANEMRILNTIKCDELRLAMQNFYLKCKSRRPV